MGTKRRIICLVWTHRWDVVSDGEGLHQRCVRCGKRRRPDAKDQMAMAIRGMRNGGGGVGV